jgi:hypothetical protein
MSEAIFRARQLDELGRCCGRKPLVYKRDRFRVCMRCNAAFDLEQNFQIKNWAWKPVEGGFTPTYPESEGVKLYSEYLREA